MKNLNIHIVGLGNLGSAFLNGLIKSNLFDRDSTSQSVQIDGKFPKSIQPNPDTFKDWIS